MPYPSPFSSSSSPYPPPPPAVIGGLFIWRAVGDVPFVNVEFFPDDAYEVALDGGPPPNGEPDVGSDSGPEPTPRPSLRSELLLSDTELAVTLAFAPDGRLFYNELLTGTIRVVLPDGTLLPEPFAHVDVTHRPLEDVVVDDCYRDVAIAPDGIIYYSNFSQIRRLLPQ